MKLPKIQRKTVIKYSIFSVLGLAGFLFYTNDSQPPQLERFEFTQANESGTEFSYSGAMSDERGVSRAEFTCLEGDEIRLVIVVAMTGADRNKTSFGILSRSPGWSGSWQGTSYDLEFSGRARVPESISNISCSWQASLKDNLGNSVVLKDLQETKIRAS